MSLLFGALALIVGAAISAGLLWLILFTFDEQLPFLHLYGLTLVAGIVGLVPVVGVLIAVVLYYLMLMKWSGMSFWKTLGMVFLVNLLNRGLGAMIERYLD